MLCKELPLLLHLCSMFGFAVAANKCPGVHSLQHTECARGWSYAPREGGELGQKDVCIGPAITFLPGSSYECCRLSVGSLVVRKGCEMIGYARPWFEGDRKVYRAGVYQENKFFYIGDGPGGKQFSPYGWGSFNCTCRN